MWLRPINPQYTVRVSVNFTSFSPVSSLLVYISEVLIWDKHATPLGIFWLCICLIAGMFYEPAALRENAKVASEVDGEPSESA